MLKYFITGSAYDCFGCRGCEQICGHNAITMGVDEEGFKYPKLEVSKCVNCGLCEKVCPVQNNDSIINPTGIAYVAQNNDIKSLKESSSGGVFSIIANYVLSQHGVVYGSAFCEGMIVSQVRIDSIEKLNSLRGSKYVQSDTNETFKQAREDLRQGKIVYYTGTPCQIAGLKLFLMKEYDNLITSDLICHGTPSQQIFSTTVSAIEKRYRGRMVDYSFRDKNIGGWSCTSSSVIKGSSTKYIKYSKEMEAYFNAFSAGSLMRMACYECPFAKTERVGDITLADFWGARSKTPEFPNLSGGVSLVLANTEKGTTLIKKLSKEMYSKGIPMEWATETNHNLTMPTPLSPKRASSYKLAADNYQNFVEEYYGNYNVLRKRLKREIEFFIRSHPWIFKVISKAVHKSKF